MYYRVFKKSKKHFFKTFQRMKMLIGKKIVSKTKL